MNMENKREELLHKYHNIFSEEKKYYSTKNLHNLDSINLRRSGFFQDVKSRYLEFVGPVENKKILDVCCGRGVLSFYLANKKADVIGIDLSENHINFCKKESKRLGIEVQFEVMNAQIPDFDNNSFDIITGFRAIHHLPNLKLFFKTCYNLLKPNGFILFLEPLEKNPIVQFNRKFLSPHARTHHEHPLKMEDLRRAELIFGNIDHYEYNLLSPLAYVFRKMVKNAKIYKYTYEFLESIEKPLLKIDLFKPYCWQTVFKCIKQDNYKK